METTKRVHDKFGLADDARELAFVVKVSLTDETRGKLAQRLYKRLYAGKNRPPLDFSGMLAALDLVDAFTDRILCRATDIVANNQPVEDVGNFIVEAINATLPLFELEQFGEAEGHDRVTPSLSDRMEEVTEWTGLTSEEITLLMAGFAENPMPPPEMLAAAIDAMHGGPRKSFAYLSPGEPELANFFSVAAKVRRMQPTQVARLHDYLIWYLDVIRLAASDTETICAVNERDPRLDAHFSSVPYAS